ncbi:MAG: hypothetical protein NWF03_02335 [Candidatus Bathyarchaeota archaeon]|nr:hypothetical protein [Candidatus Bathyarchaeota archaeon]
MTKMESFNELMFEALDDTIRAILGENISKLIYSATTKSAHQKIEKINKNSDLIISYLEKLIGKEGTQVIQSFTIKRLCVKLKQEYEEVEQHFSLLDELYETKFKLLAPVLSNNSPHN